MTITTFRQLTTLFIICNRDCRYTCNEYIKIFRPQTFLYEKSFTNILNKEPKIVKQCFYDEVPINFVIMTTR